MYLYFYDYYFDVLLRNHVKSPFQLRNLEHILLKGLFQNLFSKYMFFFNCFSHSTSMQYFISLILILNFILIKEH